MTTPVGRGQQSGLDLRQHFALERTLLAYIRTGLALIGVGFVVARFGLLLRELGLRSGAPQVPGLSVWFGSALVFMGGAMARSRGSLLSAAPATQLRDGITGEAGSNRGYAIGGVAAIGVGMAGYLILTK